MADLTIDALTAVGEASKFSVRVELTDNRSNPIIGFVDDQIIVSAFTTETDDEGHTTLTLIPNADIEPANSCYTVTVGTKSFLIQKTADSQSLQDALVDSPGPLAPFGMFLLKAANLGDLLNSTIARANLGLGDAAVLDVGTTAGTVAAGDDPRFESGGVSSHPELTERDDPDQHPAASIAFTPTGTQFTADDVQELGGQIDAALDALSTGFDALAIDVAGKAEDDEVVKLTGDQDIAGVKSFTNPTQFVAESTSTIPFDRELDVVLQNTDSTDGNYMTIGLYTADGTIAGGVAAQTLDHDAHTGRWAFSTRDAGGFSAKLTIDDAVHVPDASGDDHALNRQTGDARYALGTDFDALETDVDTIETNLNDLGIFVAGLDGEIGDLDADLTAHINDTTDAHDASAISFAPTGTIAATDAQTAIAEVATDAAAAYVPKVGTYSANTDDVVASAVSGDTENRFVLDADGTMYFGSGASASDVSLFRESFGGFRVSATPSGSGTFQPLARFTGTHVGTGNGPQGLNFDPSFEPGANVSLLYGALINPRVRPATGITVSSAAGFFIRTDTGSNGGSISTLRPVQVAPPSYGTTLPTTVNAVTIQNQGTSGVTTARGLLVEQQSGATSNISVSIEASSTRTVWVSSNADNTNAASGIFFGSSADTNLYRNGANSLRTDDKFTADLGFQANSGNYRLNGSTGPLWAAGAGTPEGSVTAPIGSIYSRTDGGAGTSFYVKESGTGNTGWVAK